MEQQIQTKIEYIDGLYFLDYKTKNGNKNIGSFRFLFEAEKVERDFHDWVIKNKSQS